MRGNCVEHHKNATSLGANDTIIRLSPRSGKTIESAWAAIHIMYELEATPFIFSFSQL